MEAPKSSDRLTSWRSKAATSAAASRNGSSPPTTELMKTFTAPSTLGSDTGSEVGVTATAVEVAQEARCPHPQAVPPTAHDRTCPGSYADRSALGAGNRIHRLASTKPTGVPSARREHARSTWGSRPPRGLPSDYRPSPKPRHDPGAGDSDAPHLVYRLSAARVPYLGYRTCSPSLTNSGSSSPSATRRTASRRTRRSRS